MSNTPFSKKCEILKDFYMTYNGDAGSEASQLLRVYDLGFPAAMLVVDNAATLSDTGIQYVDDTWYGLCAFLDVDYLGDYDSYQNFMDIANG